MNFLKVKRDQKRNEIFKFIEIEYKTKRKNLFVFKFTFINFIRSHRV